MSEPVVVEFRWKHPRDPSQNPWKVFRRYATGAQASKALQGVKGSEMFEYRIQPPPEAPASAPTGAGASPEGKAK